MKHLLSHILLFAALLLTSCADDAFVADLPSGNNADTNIAEPEILDGVYASLPELIDGNAVNDGVVSRSSLTYDRGTKRMKFSWGEEDSKANMGVFRPDDTEYTQTHSVVPLNFTRKPGQDKTAIHGQFVGPSGTTALTNNTQYIAFRPFTANQPIDYKKLLVDYTGQKNHNNVMMGKYYTNTDSYAAYDASEKVASQHLGPIDYLVTVPTTTTEEGAIYFPLKRVGVIARFFIKCPAQETFEQLQLVTQNTNLFTLKGTIDLSTMSVTDDGQTVSITPTETSNAIVLDYDYVAKDATNHPGLDMTNNKSDYYDEYPTGTYTGYIVSYLMLAPVDLSEEKSGTPKVHLYLVSHDSSGTKKYYKSAELATPKLTSNMFYQWRSANSTADMPITFTEVTFQEWKGDTSISNGDSGTGTEGW